MPSRGSRWPGASPSRCGCGRARRRATRSSACAARA
jgi:hypothetical protein